MSENIMGTYPFRYVVLKRLEKMFKTITIENGYNTDLSADNSIIANDSSEIGDEAFENTKYILFLSEMMTAVDDNSILTTPALASSQVGRVSFLLEGLIASDLEEDKILNAYRFLADVRQAFYIQKTSFIPMGIPNPLDLGNSKKQNGNCVTNISIITSSVKPLDDNPSKTAFWLTFVVDLVESNNSYINTII